MSNRLTSNSSLYLVPILTNNTYLDVYVLRTASGKISAAMRRYVMLCDAS